MNGVTGATLDSLLERRVRRSLRAVHLIPWRLSVVAREGNVRLTGPVLPEDLPRVLEAVGHLSGVREVKHHLADPV